MWAIDHLSWIKYVFFLVSALLFTILIFANINDYNSFITAIRIIVILSVCLSVLAFYESVTGNYYFLDANSLEWYQNYSLLQKVSVFREPITVFGNPNNYALFLFFSFGFTLFLLIIEKKKLVKLLYAIFLFTTVFLVLITLSRSALMGIGLFLIFMIFISLRNGSKALKYRALMVLFIVGLFAGSLLIKYSYFVEGFFLLDFGTEGTSDSIRSNLIKNGFQILQNTFYFGTGLGNVEAHMSKFRGHDVSNIVNLHNMWMEILVSSGVIIFLLFISLFIKNFFQLINKNKLKANPQCFWIKSVFASLSVGFVVSSIGPSSLIGCEWFWPILALLFKCSQLKDSVNEKTLVERLDLI